MNTLKPLTDWLDNNYGAGNWTITAGRVIVAGKDDGAAADFAAMIGGENLATEVERIYPVTPNA